MAKTTAWIMTLIGLVWIAQTQYSVMSSMMFNWVIGLAFLAIGVTKLIRAYSYGRKRR